MNCNKKYGFILSAFLIVAACVNLSAADPTHTQYTALQCEGSAMPNPVPELPAEVPDSLEPVMINHISRHGARYMTSPSRALTLKRTLLRADSLGTITASGKKLLEIADYVIEKSDGRWGTLDSLGMAEQEGIAARMFANYPGLFEGGARVTAISSYVPRCIMSMDVFTHKLARLNNKLRIYTSSGSQNSPLLRPFEIDADYIAYRRERPYAEVYSAYFLKTAPVAPARRMLGKDYPMSDDNARHWCMTAFSLVSAMRASGFGIDATSFFTNDELNALWSCNNLSQYLERSANVISRVPADIASDLLADLITTADNVVQTPETAGTRVQLRFGHAETMFPLLSLMHVPGCYYLTNYYDTVGLHWRNFYVAPMACNLQMILFRSNVSGRIYVRFDLNEVPVPILPGSDRVYLPWTEARDYLIRCLPIDKQP